MKNVRAQKCISCLLAWLVAIFFLLMQLPMLYADEGTLTRSIAIETLAQPLIVDLGNIESGKTIKAVISLCNSTGSDLFVASLKSDCKCTVAEISDPSFAADAIRDLELTIEPPPMSGRFGRVVAVTFKGVDTEPTILTLVGHYESPVGLSAQEFNFSDSHTRELLFTIRESFFFVGVSSGAGIIEVADLQDRGNGNFAILLNCSAQFGELSDQLVFSVRSHGNVEKFVFPIRVICGSTARAIPREMLLEPAASGRISGKIRLIATSAKALDDIDAFVCKSSVGNAIDEESYKVTTRRVSAKILELELVLAISGEVPSPLVPAMLAGINSDGKLCFECVVRLNSLEDDK